MSPVQGKSPPVQVKEPYGNFILQPGVYNVHLPIMLESERLAVYSCRTATLDFFSDLAESKVAVFLCSILTR